MRYNGIIFDFNGTLFFDTDLHIQSWDTIAMRVVGEHMTKETLVQKYWGLANVDLIQRMTNNTLSTEECERLSVEKEALYRQYVKNNPNAALAPGVIEFFNYLKQHNIPFTIASASIKKNIDFYVSHFHLDQWIDPSTIVYDDGTYNSKYEMYLEAMKRLHVSDHVIVFEDSINGVLAAKKANANVIAISSDSLEAHDLPFLTATINDFRGIVELLEALPE